MGSVRHMEGSEEMRSHTCMHGTSNIRALLPLSTGRLVSRGFPSLEL